MQASYYLLTWGTLQLLLHCVSGSQVSWADDVVFTEVRFRGPSFLRETQQRLKEALLIDGSTSVCSHLKSVIKSSDKLNLLVYGSPRPDHSMLSDSHLFWRGPAAKQKGNTMSSFQVEDKGPVLFASPSGGQSPTLRDAFSLNNSNSLPQNRLLNVTYNCASKKLSVHIHVHIPVEVITHVIRFSRFTLSLSMFVDSKEPYATAVFSGQTTFLSLPALVAVRFKWATRAIDIRGTPTAKALSIRNATRAIIGGDLRVPPVINVISNLEIFGQTKKGVSTLAIKGRHNGLIVVLLQQWSKNESRAALIAGIHKTSLKGLIPASLDRGFTSIFGDLTILKASLSSATDDIVTSILPQIFPTNSPLAVFGSGIHSGLTAYITASIDGAGMKGVLSGRKMVFEVSSTTPLSLRRMLDQYKHLSGLASLPLVSILDSTVSRFSFVPESKQLSLSVQLPRLLLIPRVMSLSNVALNISAVFQKTLSVTQFDFSGIWSFGSLNITTHAAYNSSRNAYHIRAIMTKQHQTLHINTLFKNMLGSDLPEALRSLTLTSVAGNVYSNGNYFIVMSGRLSKGSIGLVFLKDSSGAKVGAIAKVNRMRLSDIVESSEGVDISGTPYFGELNVSITISITSGPIRKESLSSVLPSIYEGFLTSSSTLPAGFSSQFEINVSGTSSIECTFANEIIDCKIPKSVDFTVKDLARKIPGLSQAVQDLPSQITDILNTKILSFSYNTTVNGLSITMGSDKWTLVKGFLSLSGTRIHYEGRLGSVISTTSIEVEGTWHISEYSITTSISYDAVGKDFSISGRSNANVSITDVVLRFTGVSVTLPSSISSFSLTGITGHLVGNNIIVALNGVTKGGKIVCVFQNSSTYSGGAVVVDVSQFKLADLVQLASGADISDVQYFGALEIPRLRFAVATSDISGQLLQEVTENGSPLEIFRNGISRGVSGRSVLQVGNAGRVALNLANKLLTFRVLNASSLSLSAVLSAMPGIQDIVGNLPSRLSSVLKTKVEGFSFDPVSNGLVINGSLKDSFHLVPNLISLTKVKVSVSAVLGPQKQLQKVSVSGSIIFGKIPVHISVTYEGSNDTLNVVGELNQQVEIDDLISSLSDSRLNIPSVLSSVRLTKLTGRVSGDVTLIALTGSINEGQIYFIYQKSSNKPAAVGVAAMRESFRFSSLVSTALGVDISSIPYFGTLVIPDIGLTLSSHYINSPVVSALYPSSSVLTSFGDSLKKGLRAMFRLTLAEARGITASFADGQLDLQVPDKSELSLKRILQLLPNLKRAMAALPQSLQDIASISVDSLEYRPRTNEIELEGGIKSLAVVPNLLVIQNAKYSLLGRIGRNSSLKFASFNGQWVFGSLPLTTKVIYKNRMFLIEAEPVIKKGLSLQDFIKIFTKRRIYIPSFLNSLEITRALGKFENGVKAMVFVGRVGTSANVSVVYEKSKSGEVVVLAADVKQLKLSDIVLAGTGLDISKVPFFGSLVIPASSFVISSDNFSTLNLPELATPGIATELFLDTIPEGVKGQFRLNLGTAVGLIGEYAGNVLTIKPPSSVTLSLIDLISVLPEMKRVTDSLPQMLQILKRATITSFAYKPTSRKLSISLNINSLKIVPKLIHLERVIVSLNVSLTGSRVSAQSLEEEMNREFSSEHELHDNYKEYAEMEAVKVNEVLIRGKWDLFNVKIAMSVRYDGLSGKFTIQGTPPINAKSLNINSLISKFSTAKLKLPKLSLLKLENITALSSPSIPNTILIISITAGAQNRIYLVIQKTARGSGISVAADLELNLVQLIKTVAGIDLSSVSFINSFEESSLAFTAATNPIRTPLLRNVFESNSPLSAYVGGIPDGVTASLKVVIGGCMEVRITYAKKILKFSVPSKCRVTLRTILSEVPVIKSIVKVLPPPLSDLVASDLKSIQFDPQTKALSLSTNLHELNFFKVLLMRNIKLSLVAILARNGGVQSLSFSGGLILCDSTIDTQVSYKQTTQQLFFKASPNPGLSIASIIRCLFKPDFKLPSFLNSVRITNIQGQKVADTFSFVMTGRIGRKFQVFLVYKKSVGESAQFAVAAAVESFKLADLLNEAVGVDIRSVPFFGSLRLPRISLSIASENIATPLLKSLLPATSPLRRYASNLPSGFTATMDLSLRGGGRLTGTYANKVLSFAPYGGEIALGSLLNQIPGVNIVSTGITAVFKDIGKMKLRNFVFDTNKKNMQVKVYLDRFSLFGRALSLRSINIFINITFSNPIAMSVRGTGILTLGRRNYALTIHRDHSTQKYVLTIRTEKFPAIGLLNAVGGAFLPEDLQILLGKIFDINVLNATVKYPFGATPNHILISGMPQLFGLKTVHVTALLIDQGGGRKLIQKYTLPSFSISDILKRLFGKTIPSRLLQEKSDTSIILSPLTLRDMPLSVPEFRGIDIGEGISLSTTLGWPSSCGGDVFCRIMKTLLGGGKLHVQGTFKNARYFSITAAVSDVRLGGGVVLRRAGLQFVGGAEQSVGLVGSIKLRKPPVTLNAALRLTISGVKLEGSMSGCWYKAFGISAITVCNLYLAMTIAPIPPPITGLEFGGRVEIGNRRCSRGKLLTAEAYVGINTINPNENYFYADIGALTFQRFFDAFCIPVTLPKPLGDSGYPKGLKTSFSLLGKQLPHAGITIPIGFRFKGTINILGLSATADVNIQPTRFKLSVELPPLNILGVLKMYKTRREKSKGPFFHVDIRATSTPTIHISGFVEVLGISVEGRLLISSTKYEIFVEGRIFGLFIAGLRITSGYSKRINGAAFTVEGWFKNDLFNRISKGVRDALKKSADVADKHLSKAQDKIRATKAKFDSAIDKLERAKRKVDNAKRVFDVAIAKVEGARRKLDRVCRIKKCSSSCVGCPRGWKCCARAWGKCICTLPGWHSCCFRVTNPLCLAANAACWLLKKPLDLILKAVIFIVDKSRHILDVAKVALSLAQGVLHTVKLGLDAAIAVLEGIKFTYKIGVKAISALVDFALTKLVNIQEVYFKVALGSAKGGEFQCRVRAVLLGVNLNLHVRFNIYDIWSIIKYIAERAIPGLSKFIG